MDVNVGEVDIQTLHIHGAEFITVTIAVTCFFYIVTTIYRLYLQKHANEAAQQWPLLDGKCEL